MGLEGSELMEWVHVQQTFEREDKEYERKEKEREEKHLETEEEHLKRMERIISAAIYRHLQRNTLLSCTQHGFIRGKSTYTNLLEALNDWTLAVQNWHEVCVAYIDFSKAFDTVSHEKLFRCCHGHVQLQAYGGERGALSNISQRRAQSVLELSQLSMCTG